MTALAVALPAGPGEASTESFPPEARNRLRYDFGLVLNELRARCTAVAALDAGPWFALIAIASRWQSHAEAWPSQETIARFCGCSTRSVRTYVAALVRAGLVRVRREPQPNGYERLYYRPGFVLLRELERFEQAFPRSRPASLRRAVRDAIDSSVAAEPPEMVAGGAPETVAGELTDQDLEPSSCASAHVESAEVLVVNARAPRAEPSEPQTEQQQVVFDSGREPERAGGAEPSAPREELAAASPHNASTIASVASGDVVVTDEDRVIARVVLGERMARKYPSRALPRWFDRTETEQVALCTTLLEGDREAKIAAHRRALDAAFAASRNGPPTVKFVWGSVEHFLAHVERGAALARKRAARSAAQSTQRATLTEATETILSAGTPSQHTFGGGAAEREKMRADFARLFGEESTRPSFGRPTSLGELTP